MIDKSSKEVSLLFQTCKCFILYLFFILKDQTFKYLKQKKNLKRASHMLIISISCHGLVKCQNKSFKANHVVAWQHCSKNKRCIMTLKYVKLEIDHIFTEPYRLCFKSIKKYNTTQSYVPLYIIRLVTQQRICAENI